MDERTRIARIERLIRAETAGPPARTWMVERLHRLCAALVRAVPAEGAGVSLMNDTHVGGLAGAVGPTCAALEELQVTVGEGPSVEAFSSRRPVLEPDLAGRGMRRWPEYSPAARSHGVESVFAFPLQIGAARLGVLDLVRGRPGRLSADEMSDALAFADVAVSTLLDGQARAAAGHPAEGLEDVLAYRTQLYQAQGMLMVMLGVSVTDAMVRLRAHAYARERPLGEVARDIVAGNLTLERDDR